VVARDQQHQSDDPDDSRGRSIIENGCMPDTVPNLPGDEAGKEL
jgi:hypothetical protein